MSVEVDTRDQPDICEKIAHIDRMLADYDRKRAAPKSSSPTKPRLR